MDYEINIVFNKSSTFKMEWHQCVINLLIDKDIGISLLLKLSSFLGHNQNFMYSYFARLDLANNCEKIRFSKSPPGEMLVFFHRNEFLLGSCHLILVNDIKVLKTHGIGCPNYIIYWKIT